MLTVGGVAVVVVVGTAVGRSRRCRVCVLTEPNCPVWLVATGVAESGTKVNTELSDGRAVHFRELYFEQNFLRPWDRRSER